MPPPGGTSGGFEGRGKRAENRGIAISSTQSAPVQEGRHGIEKGWPLGGKKEESREKKEERQEKRENGRQQDAKVRSRNGDMA